MSHTGISEKIGAVRCADGASGVAYRALRDLICSSCGAIIKVSELFTRWRLAASPVHSANQFDTPRLVARCRACVPFVTKQDAQVSAELPDSHPGQASTEDFAVKKSPLIKHLLTSARGSNELAPGSPGANAQASDAGARSELNVAKEAEGLSETLTPTEAIYQRLAPALHGNRRHAARNVSQWRGKQRR